jgi:hypothetical protein
MQSLHMNCPQVLRVAELGDGLRALWVATPTGRPGCLGGCQSALALYANSILRDGAHALLRV